MADGEVDHGLDEEEMKVGNNCDIAYWALDAVNEQLEDAFRELQVHKHREREDMRRVLDEIQAVERVRSLIKEIVDPREASSSSPTE